MTSEDARQGRAIEHAERYAKSPLSDNYYRVTEWEDLGDGKIRAQEKEEVSREDVPEDWLEVLDDE